MKELVNQLKEMTKAMREYGILAEVATSLFTMKLELVKAGFTEEQAMQLLVAHGMGVSADK
jgi:hypothetical protein